MNENRKRIDEWEYVEMDLFIKLLYLVKQEIESVIYKLSDMKISTLIHFV